jgi:pyridoxal phosphate enzyme (YggS family)
MIASNLNRILKELPAHVSLVAVSKTKPIALLQEAYACGQRDFGENKAQEILDKFEHLPKDTRWHFIGHLQTNKVKPVIDKVHLIHSMDRESLFVELEKQAGKLNRAVDVLLQFHIAEEETKHGFSWDEAATFLNSGLYKSAAHVRVVGVMGMATFTENLAQVQHEFETLKTYFDTLKQDFFMDSDQFRVIAMGMSGDYEIAIACGSNMVRVGSAIFGER